MTKRLFLPFMMIAAGAMSVVALAHDIGTYYPILWKTDRSQEYQFTTSFPALTFRDRVTDGFIAWNQLGEPVTFSRGANTSDFDPAVCPPTYGKNGIHWRAIDGPFDPSTSPPSGVVSAQVQTCYFTQQGTELYSANMSFDSAEAWYTGTGATPDGQIDMWSVASHEAGHMTGWSGHYDDFQVDPAMCDYGSDFHQTMCKAHVIGTVRGRTLEAHDTHTFGDAYP